MWTNGEAQINQQSNDIDVYGTAAHLTILTLVGAKVTYLRIHLLFRIIKYFKANNSSKASH